MPCSGTTLAEIMNDTKVRLNLMQPVQALFDEHGTIVKTFLLAFFVSLNVRNLDRTFRSIDSRSVRRGRDDENVHQSNRTAPRNRSESESFARASAFRRRIDGRSRHFDGRFDESGRTVRAASSHEQRSAEERRTDSTVTTFADRTFTNDDHRSDAVASPDEEIVRLDRRRRTE